MRYVTTFAAILAVVLTACTGVNAAEQQPVVTISQIPSLLLTAGESSGVVFAAAGTDALTLTATSSDQTIVRGGDILIRRRRGMNGYFDLFITSQSGVFGSTLITIRAKDGIHEQFATMKVLVGTDLTKLLTFQNKTTIRINDDRPAGPFPSTINISGVAGNITRLAVSLDRLWHTFPEDMDVLVVSPSGAKVSLLSDSCGGNPIPTSYSITPTFCTWSSNVASTNELRSTTYAASNLDRLDDPFPPPAPSPPYGAEIAELLNQSPNGEWKLFVVDDTAGDFGAILDGWTLEFETEEIALGLLLQDQAVAAVIRGNVGTRVILQGSDNLVAWNTLGAGFLDFSTISLIDLAAAFPNAIWSFNPLGIAKFDLGFPPPYRFFRVRRDAWPEFRR